MAEFEYDQKDGIICPWCVGSFPIFTCKHNPFKLMEEVERLKKEIVKSRHAKDILDSIHAYIERR